MENQHVTANGDVTTENQEPVSLQNRFNNQTQPVQESDGPNELDQGKPGGHTIVPDTVQPTHSTKVISWNDTSKTQTIHYGDKDRWIHERDRRRGSSPQRPLTPSILSHLSRDKTRSPSENKNSNQNGRHFSELKDRPASQTSLSFFEDTDPTPSRPKVCNFIPESRSSSRQSRYHELCTPTEDPNLIIGSRSRILSARLREEKSRKNKRPNRSVSATSLLSHRESVVNLIYSGRYDTDEPLCRGSFELERRHFLDSRASSVLSNKMASPLQECGLGARDYPVMEEEYSFSRCSMSRPTTTPNSTPTKDDSYRPGFLYQIVNFDSLADNVPPFVKQNVKKNGRLVTETFILKVNYLRRRRQLGETSSTINNNVKRAQQMVTSPVPMGGGLSQGTTPRSGDGVSL